MTPHRSTHSSYGLGVFVYTLGGGVIAMAGVFAVDGGLVSTLTNWIILAVGVALVLVARFWVNPPVEGPTGEAGSKLHQVAGTARPLTDDERRELSRTRIERSRLRLLKSLWFRIPIARRDKIRW